MKKFDVYQQVLEGKITLNVARQYLSSGEQGVDEEIVVLPSQVTNVLQMYLRNGIDAKELSEWASFLVASDAYVCPDWEDDEKAEKYEPMWYILQQLSSPEIDDEITQEGVRQHLQTLHNLYSLNCEKD